MTIVARADGVGPLDGSEVSLERLRELFPDHTVAFVAADPDDEIGEDHFEISRGDDLILEVHGRRITVDSDTVDSDFGVRVGDTYDAVVDAIGPLQCEDGGAYASTTEGYAFCWSPKHEHYSFHFMDMDEEGHPRTIASDLIEDRTLLGAATLDRMIWMP